MSTYELLRAPRGSIASDTAALLTARAFGPMNGFAFLAPSSTGLGVFARVRLQPGSTIGEVCGPRLPMRMLTKKASADVHFSHVTLDGLNFFVDAAGLHAPHPSPPTSPCGFVRRSTGKLANARLEVWPVLRPSGLEVRQNLMLVATEPIAAGGEIRIAFDPSVEGEAAYARESPIGGAAAEGGEVMEMAAAEAAAEAAEEGAGEDGAACDATTQTASSQAASSAPSPAKSPAGKSASYQTDTDRLLQAAIEEARDENEAWRHARVPPPPPTPEEPSYDRLSELQMAAAQRQQPEPCLEPRAYTGAVLPWEGAGCGDDRLRALVPMLRESASAWPMISTHLPGRSGRECRERWNSISEA